MGGEVHSIELASELHAAGKLPLLAMDKLENLVRSVPTVELHDHRPALWQARRNSFEHLARDGVLAAKTDALIRLACAIDGAHRAVAQIQLKVERGGDLAHAHRADEIAEPIDVTRLLWRAARVVVMNVDDFDPPGSSILLAKRVVNVEVDFLSLTTFLTLLDGEGDLRLNEFRADALGAPRTHPQKVSPVRSVSRLDELALQSGQSVLTLANQQSVAKVA